MRTRKQLAKRRERPAPPLPDSRPLEEDEKKKKTKTNDNLYALAKAVRTKILPEDVERHVQGAIAKTREKAASGQLEAIYHVDNPELRQRVTTVLREEHGFAAYTAGGGIFITIVPPKE